MTRALITGVTGQDGSYLAELLLAKGYEVFGLVRRSSTTNLQRINHLLNDSSADGPTLQLIVGDVTDGRSLAAAVEAADPDEVYSLAAQSHVKVSFEVPEATADVTGMGVLRLLQAVREIKPTARFFQAGSSEQFGRVSESPQNEATPFYPRSPYACAKVFAYHLTRNYREAYGMFASNGIFFNHESPRRGEDFVTKKITLAAQAIQAGKQQTLWLGNLNAQRDWGFAGDYVEAMWQILQAEESSDFVVASGVMHSVREFCELAFRHVGIELTWEGEGLDEQGFDQSGNLRVGVDSRYFRPTEVDALRGDFRKIQRLLGWQPSTSFETLVEMMMSPDRCGDQ